MTPPPETQPSEGPRVRLEKDTDGRPYVGQSAPFDEVAHNAYNARAGNAGNPYSGAGNSQWAEPAPPTQADASTRKLVAALLAIFLGSLGLHKFYLGYTGAGLVLLLVNLGGWFVTTLLSIITLGVAGIFLLPLMSLVSSVIVICTIIEGVVYLSKTDTDFYQTYLVGRREWF